MAELSLAYLNTIKMDKAGGTFTGFITLSGDPTSDLHAATKRWVDAKAAKDSVRTATTADLGVLAATTTTLTGPPTTYTTNGTTTASSTSVTGVASASSKIKVGASVTGTGIPASTTVAAVSGTTVTLSAAATAAGTVSLTFTQTISALVIDGVTVVANDRILVKNQTASEQNGIYYVSTLGTTSVAWVLTRATDADTWVDLAAALCSIEEGTTNQNTMWYCTANTVGGTLGTTSVPWQLVSNPQIASLAAITTNGFLSRTAANTVTPRTVAVSGTGLSITNADGVAGNPTITSNATNANTASTIVARDASGNFNAGSITLSGNLTTSTGDAPRVKVGNAYFSSVGGSDLVIRNCTELRFGSSATFDWNVWGGIGYDSATANLTIGGSASSAFSMNSSGTKANIIFDGINSFKVNGPIIEGDANYKILRNLCVYSNNTASAAGAFFIETGLPWNSAMMFKVKIEGYFYDSTAPFELIIGGYMYNNNTFANAGVISLGLKVLKIRLAKNDATSKMVIIIGDEAATYPYPKMAVTSFMEGYGTPADSHALGWSISQKTALTGYSYATQLSDLTMANLAYNVPTADVGGNIWVSPSTGGTALNNNYYAGTTTAPSNPQTNQLWFDVSTKSIKYWDGSAWQLFIVSVPTTDVGGNVWIS
jgi:hypothetical protein